MIDTNENIRHLTKRRLAFILPVLLLGVFLVLFFNVNNHWVVLHIPALPWNADAVGVSFEVAFGFFVFITFMCGVTLTMLLNKMLRRESSTQLLEAQQKIVFLREELSRQKKLFDSQKE
jgi:energy-coupling factor transporter transmembrane protein EcfT